MTSNTNNTIDAAIHRNPANSAIEQDYVSEPEPTADAVSGQVAEPDVVNRAHGEFRIAFITDDAYRAEIVSDVTRNTGWQLVQTVGNRNPGAWLQNEQVDVVLIDLDITGAVVQLTQLAAAHPSLPLIALATPHHLVELQDALLAGAKAFIPFPLNEQQFVATVLRVAHQEDSEPVAPHGQNQVIAVAGLKGGVGRSTVALNLAVALKQAQSTDVILLEAHHGLSDISVMASLHPNRTLAHIASAGQIDRDIVAGSLHSHSSGVKILAAPTAASDLVELPLDSWHQLLEELTALAPTVIIDTSADPNGLLSEVLTFASDIVIVAEPHMTSLNGAHGLLQSLRDENVRTETHLIINRSGLSGSINTSAICKRLELPVLAELPDDAPLVTYAINRGVPIVTSHPRSAMSRCIEKVADHFSAVQSDQAHKPEVAASSGPLVALRNKAASLASLL